jgi:hypothetical protein
MAEPKHPAYHSLTRKFRKFLGMLMNAEEVLKGKGFALAEAYAYAGGEHRRLDALRESAETDPAKGAELWREEQKAEPILFERMSSVIDLIQTHQPDHPLLPDYLVYRVRWRECLGEPVRSTPSQASMPIQEDDATAESPSTYGMPWSRLEESRKRLRLIPLSHRLVAPYTIFLCGLMYGSNYASERQRAAEHLLRDGLSEAARQNLENAVDFALSDETGAVANESVSLPPALSRLFMGIGYAQRTHSADVYEWLHSRGRAHFQNQLLRLLFAMGVRAATDVYARQILSFASDSSDLLAANCFGPDIKALVRSFEQGNIA